MYDINDFWQMELLKSHLPKCTFISNTNGDYLDKGCFELISLYIDELTIMNYDNLPEEKMVDNLKYWAERHPIKIEKNSKGLYTEYKGMKVLYVNWENWNITNRGGLLEEAAEPRTCRCLEPHYFIGINWDGTVSPCCNIRSPQEFPQHEPFCLGNLKEKSLQEMLNSSTMFRFREQAYYPDKDFGYDLNPCQYCSNAGGRYTRKEGGILYD
jgi:MoaA/NifB/PqqE/SkfB family radical SAM enzyme